MPQIAPAIIGKATKKQDVNLNAMYQLPYDYGNSFYSYTYGMTHNIVLNSYADFEPGSNQYKWLVNDLNSINRDITPWVAVVVHCPIYNTFSLHQRDPPPVAMKKYLEPLFVKHRVNFVLSGHLHAYMRTKNVVNNAYTPTGPIHIILGNGGKRAKIVPFRNEIPEEWVAIRDHTTYGYGTIEYLNATMALYEWIQTGHNSPEDHGENFLNVPKNIRDLVYIENQNYL